MDPWTSYGVFDLHKVKEYFGAIEHVEPEQKLHSDDCGCFLCKVAQNESYGNLVKEVESIDTYMGLFKKQHSLRRPTYEDRESEKTRTQKFLERISGKSASRTDTVFCDTCQLLDFQRIFNPTASPNMPYDEQKFGPHIFEWNLKSLRSTSPFFNALH
jgi:hypothetical protein